MHTEDVKHHFVLRGSKGIKHIYEIVYFSGKQYRRSTRLSVKENQWLEDIEEAHIGNRICALDRANNQRVNEKLTKLREDYFKLIDYLCTKDDITHKNIEDYMKGRKNKTEGMNSSQILSMALNLYVQKVKPKDSSVNQYYSTLKQLSEHFKGNPKEEFTQESYNVYVKVLEADSIKSTTKNERLRLLRLLINHIIIPEGLVEGLTPIANSIGFRKKENEESKHFALTQNEVSIIMNAPLVDDKQTILALMKLQLSSGLRFSDLYKLVRGEYKQQDNFAIITTTKRSEEAFVELSQYVKLLIIYLKGKKEIGNIHFNRSIKEVAKKLGLERYVEKNKAKVYDCLSSHDFRYSFATECLRNGESKESVAQKLGHKDTKMLETIYEDLNREDIVRKLNNNKKSKDPNEALVDDYIKSGAKSWEEYLEIRSSIRVADLINNQIDYKKLFPTLTQEIDKYNEMFKDFQRFPEDDV